MKNILLAMALAAYTGLAAQSTNELVVTNFDGTVVAAAEKVKSLEANRKRTDLANMLAWWRCNIIGCRIDIDNYEKSKLLGCENSNWLKTAEFCHVNAEKAYGELTQTIKAVELLSTDEKLKKEAQKIKQRVAEMKAGDETVKWYDSRFISETTAR